MSCRILALDTASGTAHTNSTDEAVLASYTIPAGGLAVGKILRFRAVINVTSTNSTDTLQLRCRLGGTTLTGTAFFTSNATDVADNDLAVIEGELVCRSDSDSESGTVIASAIGSDTDAATEALGAHWASITSLDLTSDLYLEVTGDWSVAHADNSVQSEAFTVLEIT